MDTAGDFATLLDGGVLTSPAVPPTSDAMDEWAALLAGGGLTPPPILPTLLPIDLIGEESGMTDTGGLTPPPHSPSLSPTGDIAGIWDASGFTLPTILLGLENPSTNSERLVAVSSGGGDGSDSEPQSIATAGMRAAG